MSGRRRSAASSPPGPSRGLVDLVPGQVQQVAQHLARVRVVLHDENAARAPFDGAATAARGRRGGRRGERGQAHRERAAVSRARARRVHAAAVQLGDASDQGEAEPQAARAAVGPALALGEEIEDARQHLGRDPDAGVADAQDRFAALRAQRDLDARRRPG